MAYLQLKYTVPSNPALFTVFVLGPIGIMDLLVSGNIIIEKICVPLVLVEKHDIDG